MLGGERPGDTLAVDHGKVLRMLQQLSLMSDVECLAGVAAERVVAAEQVAPLPCLPAPGHGTARVDWAGRPESTGAEEVTQAEGGIAQTLDGKRDVAPRGDHGPVVAGQKPPAAELVQVIVQPMDQAAVRVGHDPEATGAAGGQRERFEVLAGERLPDLRRDGGIFSPKEKDRVALRYRPYNRERLPGHLLKDGRRVICGGHQLRDGIARNDERPTVKGVRAWRLGGTRPEPSYHQHHDPCHSSPHCMRLLK